jgi:hypothetical protein
MHKHRTLAPVDLYMRLQRCQLQIQGTASKAYGVSLYILIVGNILPKWNPRRRQSSVLIAVAFYSDGLVEIDFVDVTPSPFLTTLGGLNNRMMRFAEMGARMAIF